jgi:hypothetical protein
MVRSVVGGLCVVLVLACGSKSEEATARSNATDANVSSSEGDGNAVTCAKTYETLNVDWGDYEIPIHAGLGRVIYESLVALPNERGVATIVSGQTLAVFAINENVEANVHLDETWSLEDAGLSADGGFYQLAPLGDGLIVLGYDTESQLFLWQPELGFTPITLPEGALNGEGLVTTADGSVFIGRYRGQMTDGEWLWTPIASEQAQVEVLAADGNDVWVASPQWSGTLEHWTSTGELIQSFETVGYSKTIQPLAEGWLIGEVGSCGPFARCQAALEWVTPTGDLRNLADLRVISPTDGPDGVFDLELHDEQLFVAHGLSGLMTGSWNEQAIELSSLEKWMPAAFLHSGTCGLLAKSKSSTMS